MLSNKQKLDRGLSRESKNNFNNGTLLNFGTAGQSTRSTFIKTPLMFGLNAQAKVRETNINFINGLASQPSIYSNNNPAFSPRSGLGGNYALI